MLVIMLTPSATIQAVLWRYKFSQLKGSSDDGKSKIKFLFQNQDTKLIEAKVSQKISNTVYVELHLSISDLSQNCSI